MDGIGCFSLLLIVAVCQPLWKVLRISSVHQLSQGMGPIESVPQNIDLGAYLVQQFHVSEKANIARAWLEVGQISPTAIAVELWGTPEQISLMKRFIAKQIDKNQYIWKKLNGEGMINKALTSTD